MPGEKDQDQPQQPETDKELAERASDMSEAYGGEDNAGDGAKSEDIERLAETVSEEDLGAKHSSAEDQGPQRESMDQEDKPASPDPGNTNPRMLVERKIQHMLESAEDAGVDMPHSHIRVINPGHKYELFQLEDPHRSAPQEILFIKKEPRENDPEDLKLIHNGTSNEALMEVLIDRLQYLNSDMSCPENDIAIEALKIAHAAMIVRTQDRKQRGVEGTHKE